MHEIIGDLRKIAESWKPQMGVFKHLGGLGELRVLVDDLASMVTKLEAMSATDFSVGDVVETPRGRAIVKRFDISGDVVVDLVDKNGSFRVDFVNPEVVQKPTPEDRFERVAKTLLQATSKSMGLDRAEALQVLQRVIESEEEMLS